MASLTLGDKVVTPSGLSGVIAHPYTADGGERRAFVKIEGLDRKRNYAIAELRPAELPSVPRNDDRCWPFPCRDYHATELHRSGEDPCACRCHETDSDHEARLVSEGDAIADRHYDQAEGLDAATAQAAPFMAAPENNRCLNCGEPEMLGHGAEFGWFDAPDGLFCQRCGLNPLRKTATHKAAPKTPKEVVTMARQTVYGNKIERGVYRPLADVITVVATPSATGNVILRGGVENEPRGSWHQTSHTVLTADEAERFAADVLAAVALARKA